MAQNPRGSSWLGLTRPSNLALGQEIAGDSSGVSLDGRVKPGHDVGWVA